MKLTEIHGCLRISVFGALLWGEILQAAPAQIQGELLDKEGMVEFSQQFTNWAPAAIGLELNVQDRLRTLALSREFLIQTPHAIGASRGTEFLVQVEPGQTLLTVFDGEVSLANPQGSLILTN